MAKPLIGSQEKWDGLENFVKNNLQRFISEQYGFSVYRENEERFIDEKLYTSDKYGLLLEDGTLSFEDRSSAPRWAIAIIIAPFADDMVDFFVKMNSNRWKVPVIGFGIFPNRGTTNLAVDEVKKYFGAVLRTTLALSSTGVEYDRAFYYGAVIDSYGMPTFDLIELDGFTAHILDENSPYKPYPPDPNIPDVPDIPGDKDNPDEW